MHEPKELGYSTCRGLLASGVVGRVAIGTPAGPRIFTVNYSVVDEAIVFRTTPHSTLGAHARDARLAFQVDSLDYGSERGWSVTATGRGAVVDNPDLVTHIRAVWEPRPWVEGRREVYVRLAWDELNGLQLGLGRDPKGELPIRRVV